MVPGSLPGHQKPHDEVRERERERRGREGEGEVERKRGEGGLGGERVRKRRKVGESCRKASSSQGRAKLGKKEVSRETGGHPYVQIPNKF